MLPLLLHVIFVCIPVRLATHLCIAIHAYKDTINLRLEYVLTVQPDVCHVTLPHVVSLVTLGTT